MANPQLRFIFLATFLLVSWPAVSLGEPVQAPAPQADDDDEAESDDRFELSATLFTDRKTSQAANAFREEVKAGRHNEALTELSKLQFADPHLLVPMANGTWGSVFLNVLVDFHLLPKSFQRKIIGQSSGIARSRLDELLASQDLQKLPEFWLRYPGTKQSVQAMLLMSRIQIDRGQVRAAEFWLKLVVDTGDPEFVGIAQHQLSRLAAAKDGEDAAETESPNTADGPILPQYADWSFRPSMAPDLEGQIREFRRVAHRSGVTPTSTWEPEFDSERAYLRTLRGVAGIQRKTGQAAWHYPISPPIDKQLQQSKLMSMFQTPANRLEVDTDFIRFDASLLASVFCRDEVQTHPVVSGGRVFVVAADSDADGPVTRPSRLFGGPISLIPGFRPGQLIALDAETGRRIWTVGRATLAQHLGPGDFGVWFHGPPCVTNQTVLSVFEWKGEVRIGKFSAETGQYLSSTPVSLPEQSIDKDVVRTFWASTPVRDGGMLWSTTSTGWLLCLDESTMSVLWASRLADESSLRSTDRIRRGRAAAMTAQQPLRERWNRSLLNLSGKRMLVLSQESQDAILLDSRTGHRVKTVQQSGTNLMFSDRHVFVILDGPIMRCFRMQDGEQIWEESADFSDRSDVPQEIVRPTGTGVRREGHLLLPLSDGHLATVNLASGESQRGDSLLLPPDGWGHLKQTSDGSLFYVAADQTTRLSYSEPSQPSIEHLAIGLKLLATGQAKEALREARQIDKTDRDFRAAKNLEFDCLLQLSRTNSKQYLSQLQEAASSDLQQAQVLVLDAESQSQAGQHVEAITSICSLLQKPASVIHVPMPSVVIKGSVVSKVQFPDGRFQTDSTKLTIHTWAMSALSDLLSQVEFERWPMDAVKSIPPALWAGINTPDAVSLVREQALQALQARSLQLSFELFQHGVRLAHAAGKKTADDYQNDVAVLDDILNRLLGKDEPSGGVPRPVVRHLLSVAVAELPEPFVEAVRVAGIYDKWDLQWPDQLHQQYQQARREWTSKWDHDDWDVLPIRERTTRTVLGRVNVVDRNDPFLKHYQWALKHGTNARFFSFPSLHSDQAGWNVPLSESITHNLSVWNWVSRCGTVLLVRSFQRLTAVSVLDGDVMWSIPTQGQVGHAHLHTFRDFNVRTVAAPGSQRPPGWRLLTADGACLSMQAQNNIEARRLLTGDVLWEVSQSVMSRPVVAGRKGALRFSGDDGKGLLVDVKSGLSQPTDLDEISQSAVMSHTENEVVAWQQGGSAYRRIVWGNPQTGEITKSVSLAEFTFFQFVDSSVLAAINETGDLWFVDLNTSQVTKYRVPFQGEAFPNLVTERFVLANDQYLYVVLPTESMNIRRRAPSLRAMPADGQIFVLDRSSGKLVSTITTEDEALMFFQDPSFPLILIGSQPNQDPNKGPLVMRGYDVGGKRKQFEARFPLNYGISNLEYQINKLGSFDLMLGSSSFRIQAVDQESKERSSEE